MSVPKVRFVRRSKRGFSVVELLIAVALAGAIATSAMAGLFFVLRNEARLRIQTQVNAETQQVIAFVRRAFRLTSLQDMQFYPPDGTPVAVGFPAPSRDDAAGDRWGADGRIVWGETLIIHPWPHDDPQELRLTRFRDRDNSLSHSQREHILEQVVKAGNGDQVSGDKDPVTRVLSKLSPQLEIRKEGRSYDFYSSTSFRDREMVFGGVALRAGANSIRLTVSDRNKSSSGYGMRIDQLRISPTGLPIEAEALLPQATSSGATPTIGEDLAGNWSNRRWLDFAPSGPNAYIEMTYYNDTWHETLFLGGSSFSNIVTYINSTPGEVGARIRPAGGELAWSAPLQTSAVGFGAGNTFTSAAVRVVIRGADAEHGHHILTKGDGCRVQFRATDTPTDHGLFISDAFIAEAADHLHPSSEIDSSTLTRLHFGDPAAPVTSQWIPAGTSVETTPLVFPIDPQKSYVISYLVGYDGTSPSGAPWIFHLDANADALRADSYVIPGSSDPSPSDIATASWNDRADLLAEPAVIGVESLHTTHAARATYVSRIVDTKLTAAPLKDLTWNSIEPDNTSVSFKIRAFNELDQTDAPDWDHVSKVTVPGALPAGAGNARYLQVQVQLESDLVQDRAPELRDFTLRWEGQPTVMDIGGVFGRFPSAGMVEVLVNDAPPAVSLRADMIAQGKGQRVSPLTWALGLEVTPRN